MDLLNAFIENQNPGQLLAGMGIFIACIVVLKIFNMIILSKVKKLAQKTNTVWDDVIIEFLEEIRWPFYILASFYVSSKGLVMPLGVHEILDKMIALFIVFYAVKFINKIIEVVTDQQIEKRKKDGGQDSSLLKVLSGLGKAVTWIIAGLLVLSNFGIDVTSLIAGLGIGGIAIAFALQRILEDIFSSFSIYFDKPFEEGDFIIIGDDMGTVKRIGLKTTRIRHLMGQELVVSNTELTSARIHNYKKMKKRRIVFKFGVEYGTTLPKVKKICKIVKDIFSKISIAELDRVHFKEFGDFSLNFEVVYYLNSSDYNVYMDTQQQINWDLMAAFEKEKIDFAFPTQTIHLKR